MLIVDEIASLTAYIGDRKLRADVEQLVGLLLSQGRAVGVSVIAAVQDPSKDVLPIRQLFSIRVGLRMTESNHHCGVIERLEHTFDDSPGGTDKFVTAVPTLVARR